MTQYNTSTQQVKIYDEISSATLAAKNLWEIDQCFSSDTHQRLRGIVETQGNEFVCAGLRKRLELTPSSSEFLLLDQIGQQMCDSLSTLTGYSLKFMTVKYWLDLPGFGCQLHQDAEDIFVSYQVYLGSSFTDEIRSEQNKGSTDNTIKCANDEKNMLMARGAKFMHTDPPVQIEFKPNHGYINLNSDLKLHQVDGTWDTRISVMFQYARV